ncbi:MAG: prepilin peptidase [Gammaproteobacteria bacterium]|jgi:leader peptidase (prepilin peptidase)/N-methyltransferase|nr:prepilin peptidase [Gammaproteobacteria bacterium]
MKALIISLHIILPAWIIFKFGLGWQSFFALIFTEYLLILSIIDLYTGLLPDCLTLSLLWLGLFANLFHLYTSLQSAVIGAISAYLGLWVLYWLFKLLRKKEGMGYGDFKLLAAIGAWLGWQALPMVLGLASGLSLLIILWHYCRKKTWLLYVPFGPGLAGGGWLALNLLQLKNIRGW